MWCNRGLKVYKMGMGSYLSGWWIMVCKVTWIGCIGDWKGNEKQYLSKNSVKCINTGTWASQNVKGD